MSWIGVDLDGTLAEYHGWQGIEHIGAPIPAMVERVKNWRSQGMCVKIFTARLYACKTYNPKNIQNALAPIQAWCNEHLGEILPVTCVKDFGMTQLWDDRAIGVEKNTGRPTSGPLFGEDVLDDMRRIASIYREATYVAHVDKRREEVRSYAVDAIVKIMAEIPELRTWARAIKADNSASKNSEDND